MTLCLNMIVKDEAHIITQTLQKLTSKIKFDYYVICDTGSTDNTCELIKTFFKNKNIPGETHYHTWKDFGHNRTLALKEAYNKSDYLFIFDADDEIVGDFVLPSPLTLDSYMLKFGTDNAYDRMSIVKNTIPWYFVGVLHEYITTDTVPTTKGTIDGNYHIHSGRTSSRNKNPNKYLDDAMVLEKGYHESLSNNDGLHNRYAYYCANSYVDAKNYEKAIEWYLLTLTLNGWYEERYNACLKLYELYKSKNDKSCYYYLVKSFGYNNKRVEGIFLLIQHYCCEGQYDIAMNYYTLIQKYYENEYPMDNLSSKLFARVMDYTFYLPYYIIIVSE